jgi:RHS repeat-associated protein
MTMRLRRLTEWLNGRPAGRRAIRWPRLHRLPLRLEQLEDRTAPAVVPWSGGGGDTNWTNPLNWLGNAQPGSADDAVIGAAFGGITVTVGSNVTIHSVTSSAAVAINTGTFSIAAASTMQALTLNGGTLTGAGDLTVTGPLTWANGIMSGPGSTTALGGLQLGAADNLQHTQTLDGRNFTNAGAAVWLGNGGFNQNGFAQYGCTFTNAPGATLDIQNSLSWTTNASGGTFVNQGTLKKSAGAGTTAFQVALNNTGAVQALAGTLSLAGGGTHTGTFAVSAGATLAFGGGTHTLAAASSVAGAGTVAFSGGTTTVGGTYNVTGATQATGGAGTFAAGAQVLAVGPTLTVTGGGLTFATGATYPPAFTFTNLTVSAPLTFSPGAAVAAVGTLTVTGGTLTFNGGAPITVANLALSQGVLAGSDDMTVTGTLTWTGGTMRGPGGSTTALGGLQLGAADNQSHTETLDSRTLINAGGAVWLGNGGFNQYGATFTNAPGATLDIQNSLSWTTNLSGGTFVNQGTLKKSAGAGATAFLVPVNNTGSVVVQQGSLTFGGNNNLTQFSDPAFLSSQPGTTFNVYGSLTGSTRDADLFNPQGAVVLSGPGTAAAPQLLEVMSQDRGSVAAGYTKNFAYGTITLGNGTYVKLVDAAHNAAGTGPEALYADTLIVPAGTTLDLNGLPAYVRAAQVSGTVVGTTLHILADGGALGLNTPVAGALSAAGEVDDWTFYARAGQAVTAFVGTGAASTLVPVQPPVNYAQISLLDPSGNVLATAANVPSGANASLLGVPLPADGTYHVRVQAPAAHAGSTGFYSLVLYDATVRTAPLPLNQTVTGALASPYSVDHWTFAATANQVVQFTYVNAANGSIQFDLTGPNGYTAFSGSTTSSGPIVLPTAGSYVLSVHSAGNGGAYAFRLLQSTLIDLTLGTPYQGTLTGSGQAQLFRLTLSAADVQQGNPLLISLTDSNPLDVNELYVSYDGSPPTRDSYDYRSPSIGANQQIALFGSVIYILVYNNHAAAHGGFTLLAQSAPFILTGISPSQAGNTHFVPLHLTGAFVLAPFPGGSYPSGYVRDNTRVQFLRSDGTLFPLNLQLYSESAIEWFRGGDVFITKDVTAIIPANALPAGVYTVIAQNPSNGYTQSLPNAYRVVQGGVSILQTEVVVPNPIGFHTAATIDVYYSNIGNAPMAAPLLELTATQNGIPGALLTLHGSGLDSGFWTSATPDGYSQSVQFLASGASPGLLLPGERVKVPVYYVGWLQNQWDFSRPPIIFSLGALDTLNTDPINWPALKDSLRPASLSPGAWNAVYPNLTPQLGSTWGAYVQRLDDDVQYLAGLGETVTDIGQLYTFEVEQANGFSPISSLAGATDASLAAPGLPLSFARSFPPSIIDRNRLGRFGWGWADTWDTSITVDADGTVNVLGPGSSRRRYQPDRRGGYFAQPGDHATLAPRTGGGYTLTALDGQVTAYNPDGSLAYVQDTNGNRITAAYAGGRLTTLTHSSGQSLTLTYNAAGLVSTITDSVGRATTYTYDATNQYLTTVVGFDGRTTQYTYDTGANPTTAHALLTVTHPDGTHDFYAYDARGHLTDAHRDGNAEDTTFTYTAGAVAVADALGNATTYSFDNRGLLVQVQNALGSTVHFAYDTNLNLIQAADAAGQLYANTFDARGNLLSSTDPLGHTVKYTYSATDDRLASVTDANGNATRYGYDGQGNLTSTTYADGTVESVAYDPVGDVLSTANRRGQAIHYTYDAAGNVLTKTFPDNSQVTYTYDAHENLTAATDPGGTTTLTYDAADRLTRITYPGGRYLQYTYDAAGRRTRMVDQGGFTVNYTYDAAGRLATLTDGSNGLIVRYTYDAVGRLSRKDNGNGTYTTYAYDAAGELLHLVNYAPGGAVNSRFDYTYDGLGRRITDATVDGTWTYTYDAIGQLTHAVFASTNQAVPNQDLAYIYDAAGNRTQTTINGVTTAYTTNSLNEYTQVGTTQYGYDLDGNLTTQTDASGTTTYAYNAENRLISATGPGGTWAYRYDAFGNHVASTQDGVTTQYLIDLTGLGNVVSTYSSAGLIDHYTYGLGLTSQVDVSGLAGYNDFDATGSTVGISSPSGTYAAARSYLPFGGFLASSGTAATLFPFVGETGVQADGRFLGMRARQYDVGLGRFVSTDPLGLAGGQVNLYEYALNSPQQFIDPSGLSVLGAGAKIISGVVGTAAAFTAASTAVGISAAAWLAFGVFKGASDVTAGIANLLGFSQIHSIGAFEFGLTLASLANPKAEELGRALDFAFSAAELFQDANDLIGKIDQTISLVNLPTDFLELYLNKVTTNAVNSTDPNAKTGPAGYGPQGFVAPGTALPYRIDFENDPAATAPAQRVDVTDQLDPNLDWSTFQLTGVGFGDTNIAIPPDSQHYATSVPMTYNGKSFQVLVTLDLDPATGLFHAAFQSVDPATSLPPDVLTGFLPPEDGTGRGQGYVSYAVQPKAGLPTGAQTRNVAQVQFDLGEIIATDQVAEHDPTQGVDPAKQARNTIDAGPPVSTVFGLPAVTNTASFLVQWSGADDVGGSGVGTYDVYVSDNGGAFTRWQSRTSATSAVYFGQNGHTYSFYSVATDNVGNQQVPPMGGQASTTVTVKPPLISSVVIDDGAAQRSMVRSITVTFNQVAVLGNRAFVLETRKGDPAGVGLTRAVSVVNGQTVAVLTFTGPGIVGGSLADGRYTLKVAGSQVTDALGNRLDGAGSGQAGSDSLTALSRLYGDVNGDGVVNGLDFGLFRSAFGTAAGDPAYLDYLDYNGDGAINGLDFAQFRSRFGVQLP